VVYRRRNRLRRMVRSGEAAWAADCLILQGDEAVPGQHQEILPPGPKGTLALRGNHLTWRPDSPTSRKGYREFTLDVSAIKGVRESRSRDITGVTVETWSFAVGDVDLRLQLALQTSALRRFLPSATDL
jgi:hypothetical protein